MTKCDICKNINQCKKLRELEHYSCKDFLKDYSNKFVLITGCKSISTLYKNRYGVITHNYENDKWAIELHPSNLETGGLYHTIIEDDFEVVGEKYCED